MKSVLFITIMLLKVVCTMGQANYPAAVSKFQRYYTAKQTDSLFSMFSPTMKAALPLDKTAAIMDELHTQLGEIKNITLLTTATTHVIYKATFTNAICKLILSLNDDNLLEGLRIVPNEEIQGIDFSIKNEHHTVTKADTFTDFR